MKKYMKLPDIENAFENIKEACDKRLNDLYPAGIPEIAKERYEKELEYLKTSEYLNEFEIARQIYSKSNSEKYSHFITLDGRITSSLIIYLISESKLNPLPTHYYCQKCGHFELADTKLFGIDLDSMKCPVCGEDIFADGFNLPIESVFGVNGKTIKELEFNYNVPLDFFPVTKEILASIYPNNEIVPLRIFGIGPASGYVILGSGKNVQDYPKHVDYLSNGDICLKGSIHEEPVHDFYVISIGTVSSDIRVINEIQKRTKLYVKNISLNSLIDVTWEDIYNDKHLLSSEAKDLFKKYKPDTFYSMAGYIAGYLNHYVKKFPYSSSAYFKDECHGDKVFSLKAFKQCPCYTVEDFFETLLSFGMERGKAYEIAELISKSLPEDKGGPEYEKIKEFFDEADVDKSFKTVAKRSALVFPRSHAASELLDYLIITYYSKKYSEIYQEVIYQVYE